MLKLRITFLITIDGEDKQTNGGRERQRGEGGKKITAWKIRETEAY